MDRCHPPPSLSLRHTRGTLYDSQRAFHLLSTSYNKTRKQLLSPCYSSRSQSSGSPRTSPKVTRHNLSSAWPLSALSFPPPKPDISAASPGSLPSCPHPVEAISPFLHLKTLKILPSLFHLGWSSPWGPWLLPIGAKTPPTPSHPHPLAPLQGHNHCSRWALRTHWGKNRVPLTSSRWMRDR